jgi:hypothetical protein
VHRLAGQPIDLRHALVAGAIAGVVEEAASQRQAAALILADLRRLLAEDGQIAADALVPARRRPATPGRCAVYDGTLGGDFGQRFCAANDLLPQLAAVT